MSAIFTETRVKRRCNSSHVKGKLMLFARHSSDLRRRRRSRFPLRLAAAVAAAAVAALVASPLGSEPASAAPTQAQGESLRDLAAQRGIFFGVAVSPGPLQNDSSYQDIAGGEFSSITHENDMKWESVQPSPGQFNFDNADFINSFAQDNSQRIHGHTLVWHSQLPSWVEEQGTSPEALREIMNNHIGTVAGRYAGQYSSWDAVNEPWEDDGSWRQSVFYTQLGEDYVTEALTLADQADPGASHYINDYNTDGVNAKSNAMYNLAESLVSQGAPLDGVGFQSHLIAGQVPGDYQQNLERFAELGLEVAVTELDIRIPRPVTQEKLEQQAEDYSTVVQACLNVSACQGVTVWGVSDQHSWVNDWFPEDAEPLLFDDNYQPKPAYYAVQETLRG